MELADKDLRDLHPAFKELEFMTNACYVDASKGETILSNLPEFQNWKSCISIADQNISISGRVVKGF